MNEWEHICTEVIKSGLLRIDPEHIIWWANETIARMLEIPRSKLIGKKCHEILHKAKNPPSFCPLPWVLESKGSASREIYLPHLEKWFLVDYFVDFNSKKEIKGIICSLQDVTERKQREKQLGQMDRLSALGNMAAAIAHEINNPLASISIDLERLLKEKRDRNLVRVYTKMLRLIERIADITSRLLDFSKKRAPQFKREDVNAILDEATAMVANRFLVENKEIVKHYTKTLPLIRADSHQLQQAFVNLAINALHALKEKGYLVIITSNMKQIRHVKITFKDNGCGISREDLEKIFDPFFTTKPGGSGLGLTIVRQIIKQHGGTIEINSAPGKGTRIDIFLPSVLEQA